ncbi:MAG TPA: response regulator transcription factor [Methylovirgula sp.]
MGRTRSDIVIADDHPLVRGALRQAVEGAFKDVTVTETSDFDQLIQVLAAQPETDLVLLDLAMPGMHGFSGLIYLRAQYANIPVVVVSANDNRGVMRRCVEIGAAGFIPKTLDLDAMRGAIAAVLAGGLWLPPDLGPATSTDPESADILRRLASLTPQQMRVLMMLSEGLLNKQIAFELSVSEATIKAHVSAILQKLRVESRTQAVIAAAKIAQDQLLPVG